MLDIVSIGGCSSDIFYKTAEGKILKDKKQDFLAFEYGSKIIPEDTYFTYGGGGYNSTRNFAKLGLKAALVSSVGSEDTGTVILKNLKAANIGSQFLNRSTKLHTALSFVVVDGKDHVLFTYRGANDDLKIENWKGLKNAKWFYISSLSGHSHMLIPKIFKFARMNKIKIAWNPGSVQLEEGYGHLAPFLKETDILSLNKEEAKELVKSAKSKVDKKDTKSILAEVKSFGPKIAIITCGRQGAYVCDGFADYFQKSLSAEIIDTTGAGDAFGSTFTACQIMGLSIEVSMQKAAKNAASVVGRWGATEGLLKRSDLLK